MVSQHISCPTGSVVIAGHKKGQMETALAAKAKFNRNVGAIYLGVCLGLYPAIALMFVLTKIFPTEMSNRFDCISWLFLAFWVGYMAYAYFIKNYSKINKHALVMAGAMGILIPVFNGFHSGLWLWKSLLMGYVDSFFVDFVWLVCGAITLYIGLRLKQKGRVVAKVKVGLPIKKGTGKEVRSTPIFKIRPSSN